MIGDIPFAAVRPPENILFVCKLNPVTVDEDLELIFSRFGKILSCEVVRDRKSGDSLQYAFIEFDEQDSAEQVSHFPTLEVGGGKLAVEMIVERRTHTSILPQSLLTNGGVNPHPNRNHRSSRSARLS
jgi:RNA recognition motif-containing protein